MNSRVPQKWHRILQHFAVSFTVVRGFHVHGAGISIQLLPAARRRYADPAYGRYWRPAGFTGHP